MRCGSYATTTPACSAAGLGGHASPVRLTKSVASSFVNSNVRSKPLSAPPTARKFEQKRWKFALLGITYLPWRTPALCWFSVRWLTIAFV